MEAARDQRPAPAHLTVSLVDAPAVPRERIAPQAVAVATAARPARRTERRAADDLPPQPPLPADSPSLIEIFAAPQPYYFRADELTDKPRVLIDPSLDLASSLRMEPAHSTIVRLLINETGEVDQAINEKSTFSEDAQRVILDTFSKMKFEPGTRDGIPVKSELRIEIMLEDLAPAR